MPRFEDKALGIVRREGQTEPKPPGMDGEPSAGGGPGELRPQCRFLGRGVVEGAAGMMFAVTRGGDSGEDGSDSLSGGEFSPDDLCLAFDPAKARLGRSVIPSISAAACNRCQTVAAGEIRRTLLPSESTAMVTSPVSCASSSGARLRRPA